MPKFRRSPHVVSYWVDARVHLQNYATGSWLGGSAALCTVVDACSSWRSMDEIVERCPGLDRTTVRRMVRRLSDAHILHRSDRVEPKDERAMRAFGPWNHAAGFFHRASKNVFFRDERVLAGGDPPPMEQPRPSAKRSSGRGVIRLPVSRLRGEFPDAVLGRRSWRRFGAGSIPLSDAAVLLRMTAGMHVFVPTQGGHLLPLRTSPSAGACHPIELYVMATRVHGLPRGLYRYASDRHVLERLRRGSSRDGIQRYLPTQYAYEDAAALVFFCARYDRVIRRYPYPRAYRAAAIEAGHLCQTFCLTATWLGLAPFCSRALNDRRVEQDLGLDGVAESVLYAAGVGVRPPTSIDAAAPPGLHSPAPVPNPAFAPRRK